jgi:hypothetical protein
MGWSGVEVRSRRGDGEGSVVPHVQAYKGTRRGPHVVQGDEARTSCGIKGRDEDAAT